MSIHPRNDSTNRYPLFEEIFGNTINNTVLDFGGSSGNLLYFSNNNILQKNYTSVDTVLEAVLSGKKEFSNSKFYHYNRYNWMYNHDGSFEYKFPNVDKNQDYIWAYSVFSHTDLTEFTETIKWFLTFNFKKIALSFLTFNEMLEWTYNKRVSEYGNCIDIKKYKNTKEQNIIYFFDNNKLVVDNKTLNIKNSKYLMTFYNSAYLVNHIKKIAYNYKISIIMPGNGYIPFLCIER